MSNEDAEHLALRASAIDPRRIVGYRAEMCGRITLHTPAEVLAEEFGLSEPPLEWQASFNVAPTQDILAVVQRGEARVALPFRWGLVPFWAKDPAIGNKLINARAETLSSKSAFREAFRLRRCMVLADGFYEWERRGKRRQPVYVRLSSGAPMALAGLYERWCGPQGTTLQSATIITCAPNERIAHVHDRMPVVLPPLAWSDWLDPSCDEPAQLSRWLAPLDASQFLLHRVSDRVNKPHNDDASLIEPLPEAPAVPTNLSFDF